MAATGRPSTATPVSDAAPRPDPFRIETDRLLLRELTMDDVGVLHGILGDPETMRFYPAPKSRQETVGWIEWNLRNYTELGFGLWALILKETGEFIGDCGLTVQPVDDDRYVEVGYHVRRDLWRRGLATEAAAASRDFAFDVVGVDRLIALVRLGNEPSAGVARKIGMEPWMRTVRVGLDHVVWSMTRDRWREAVSS
jgi:RimJ/RimL family protein N-acetyltransferase